MPAGAGTEYFTTQREKYAAIVEQAQTANNKVALANQALGILAKPTISQSEAETLISLYTQVV